MSKTTITADELQAHMEELRANPPGRPEGYFTVREMAKELCRAGKCTTVNAGRTAVYRMLDELEDLGRLKKVRVVNEGFLGRKTPSTAFKILPPRGK